MVVKGYILLKNISALKKLAKNKLVLIVEDDESIMQELNNFLSKFFLNVYKATNVDDAVEIYREISKENISILVITDINLGSKNGIELTCYLKKIKQNQKVIAISAYDDKDIFIESIKCGLNRFILKPINMEEMLNALINVLKDIEYDLELEKSKKQLELSREYALKLIDEQNQFLKNAIHEINTPLAVIVTNIDLLRMQDIDSESLNSIEAGARIIQNSYEDMIYLMKHDRVAYKKTEIDLVDFVKSRINYFDCIAKANSLSISFRVGYPYLPKLSFSEPKLQRIVDNTLSNAIKYSHSQTTIHVSLGLQNENFFFEVKNSGSQIIKRKKIFERYYRESDDKGGLGLGLNIVWEICKKENVLVEVSSSSLKETSFRYIFIKNSKQENQ